jgi:hypothetical protein
MTSPLVSWSAAAPNLAEHADEGGRAAGYPAAIVAGTTVYALMTHPPAAAWGVDWIGGGGAEVRFRDAVLADEVVECVVTEGDDDTWAVEAIARDVARATTTVWRDAEGWDPRDGEALEPLVTMLDERWSHYGLRSGDDLALYDAEDLVHPAAWPCLANRIFATQLVSGAWIHTRSRIAHLAPVRRDVAAVVHPTVIDRFDTRAGTRAVVDCIITVDDTPVCVVEHEALVELH